MAHAASTWITGRDTFAPERTDTGEKTAAYA